MRFHGSSVREKPGRLAPARAGGWAAALLFLCAVACQRQEAPPRPPASEPDSGGAPTNLLLLTLDTTRPDSLGAYGGREGVTPNLDALATRGTRFDQAIASVALTRPVHSTLFTGLLPHTHGVWSNGPYRLDPRWTTLAESFSERGLTTAAVVSSFVLSRSFGLAQGFELFDDEVLEVPGADPEKGAAAVVDRAIAWLGRELEPPFLLWLHFYDPHTPYAAPEPFRSRFAEDPYLAEVAHVDHEIGRVLAELRVLGWLDETLVVAVADHGEGLGEHREDTHGYFLYDSTLRVPLIAAGPGVPAGAVIPQQVTLADLAPTLLEAFAIEPRRLELDGRAFWRELASGAIVPRPALVENRAIRHQYGWAPLAGLRVDGWKWILAPEPELYDLGEDPGETRNLYEPGSEMARRLEATRRRLLPEEPERDAATALSPEAEQRLRSLGYLSAPARASPSAAGPDPKRVAGVIARIEELTTVRREDDPAAAARLADAVLENDPTNLFALRVKSQLLVDQGRFADAVAILESIVAGHETHPETLGSLAMAYEGLGRIDDAIVWLQRATTPPWIFWPGLERLARLSKRHPDKLPRAPTLEKLSIFQPESPRERMAVARAYSALGEPDRAAHWFGKTLEAQPTHIEARVSLAQMQATLGRLDEALATLAAVDRPTVESTFVTGSVLWSKERRPEACREFTRALGMAPRNANLLLALSQYLRECGEPALADAALARLLERYPDHPQALAERAVRR